MGDTDKHLQEHRRVPRRTASPILPPDVNESREDFTVAGERHPLRPRRREGRRREGDRGDHRGARRTARSRASHDFCQRVRGQLVNRRVLESLIKCGAFDSLERNRARLLGGARRRHALGGEPRRGAADHADRPLRRRRRASTTPPPPLPDVAGLAGRGGAARRARDASASSSPAIRSISTSSDLQALRPTCARDRRRSREPRSDAGQTRVHASAASSTR